MYKEIETHGRRVIKLFSLPEDTDPMELCKKLRRIEKSAHVDAERYCNGYWDMDTYDKARDKKLVKLDGILGFKAKGIPVFINGDPRGYALKVHDSWMAGKSTLLQRDWGGYGLIAPDLTPND